MSAEKIPPSEMRDLQERAARGEILPDDILRRMITTWRSAYTARAESKPPPKSRVKAAPVDDKQIDFF